MRENAQWVKQEDDKDDEPRKRGGSLPADGPAMITGDGLRRERGRLRQTQRELAVRAGVSLRTLYAWEALGPKQLPVAAEGRLAAVLDSQTHGATGSLAEVTDAELIAELARRLPVTGSGVLADMRADQAEAQRARRMPSDGPGSSSSDPKTSLRIQRRKGQ